MANRVLLGKKGSDYGLWISKPGKNVLTITADTDFLYNSDWKSVQIVQVGRFATPTTASFPKTITIPNLGYRPMLRVSSLGWKNIQIRFASNSSIVFEQGVQSMQDEDPAIPASARYVRYVVVGSKSPL